MRNIVSVQRHFTFVNSKSQNQSEYQANLMRINEFDCRLPRFVYILMIRYKLSVSALDTSLSTSDIICHVTVFVWISM